MTDLARSTVSAGAENKFTEGVYIDADRKGTLSIEGTFVGTVTLQYQRQGETTWNDQDSKTVAERYYFQGGGDTWRAGIKTGDYTSGTAVITIQAKQD